MVRSVVELDCTIAVGGYTSTVLHLRRSLLRFLLLTGAIWRIRLIRIPPKSLLLLHRIMINRVIKIIWICTLIARSSLLTLPSWWALSIHALPMNCQDQTIHLDVVEA